MSRIMYVELYMSDFHSKGTMKSSEAFLRNHDIGFYIQTFTMI